MQTSAACKMESNVNPDIANQRSAEAEPTPPSINNASIVTDNRAKNSEIHRECSEDVAGD